MEAIEANINSVKESFEQPGFKVFGQVEQLLLKLIRNDSVVDEIEALRANFQCYYDPNSLMVELELLPVICGESQPINLGDVVKVIQSLSHEECELIRNVLVIIRIVLTKRARLFSVLRWLKTWLHSTMTQKSFNALSLTHKKKANIDERLLIDVVNEFVNLHSACLNIFGKFTGKDL